MQVAEQAPRQIPGRFRPGQSGNPRGRLTRAEWKPRKEKLIAEWTAGIGGPSSLTRVELDLLRQAAELAMRPLPRKSEDAIRTTNTISRILLTLGLVRQARVAGAGARGSRRRCRGAVRQTGV